MATLALLKGTLATIDATMQTDGSTTTSRKCMFSQIAQHFSRNLFLNTTFCTSGYQTREAGLKDLETVFSGFIGVNAAAFAPLPINTASSAGAEVPLTGVVTYTTGATVGFSGFCDDDLLTMPVQAMATRVTRIMNSGSPTVAWPTT